MDFGRFAELGVITNYTPAWHNGNMGLGCEPSEFWTALIGEERARIYMTVMRTMPTLPEESRRNPEGEGMSRMDALPACGQMNRGDMVICDIQ